MPRERPQRGRPIGTGIGIGIKVIAPYHSRTPIGFACSNFISFPICQISYAYKVNFNLYMGLRLRIVVSCVYVIKQVKGNNHVRFKSPQSVPFIYGFLSSIKRLKSHS